MPARGSRLVNPLNKISLSLGWWFISGVQLREINLGYESKISIQRPLDEITYFEFW
jgi:hypothetical protein